MRVMLLGLSVLMIGVFATAVLSAAHHVDRVVTEEYTADDNGDIPPWIKIDFDNWR